MRRELLIDSLPAQRARGCTLMESHRSETDMVRKGWTINGAPTFTGRGMLTNGVDQWAALTGTARGVRAVTFEVYPATADEALLALSATHSVAIVAGVVTPAGFAAPTVHVNGVATTAIAAGVRSFVTVSTATAFDANAITTGRVGAAFGEIEIGMTGLWTVAPTLAENAAYTANSMFSWQNRANCVLQMRTTDYDIGNVRTLDSSGNGNHFQLGDGVTPATYPTQGVGLMSFDGANDYLQRAAVPQPAGAFSVAVTLTDRSTAASPSLMGMVSAGGATLIRRISANYWSFFCGAGQIRADGTPMGVPFTIVTTWNGAISDFYRNGRDAKTATISAATQPSGAAETMFVGRRNIGEYITGDLHDFQYFPDIALTPTQAQDYHIKQMQRLGREV